MDGMIGNLMERIVGDLGRGISWRTPARTSPAAEVRDLALRSRERSAPILHYDEASIPGGGRVAIVHSGLDDVLAALAACGAPSPQSTVIAGRVSLVVGGTGIVPHGADTLVGSPWDLIQFLAERL